MTIVVMSTAVTDQVSWPGASEVQVPGGAGLYALAGAGIWTDDALLVCGMGADQSAALDWLRANALRTDGLRVRDDRTPITHVAYRTDAERREAPVHGLEHYKRMEPTPADLRTFAGEASGVYVFRTADWNFWQEVLALKRVHGFMVLWELNADAARPQDLAAVRALAAQVDILSINTAEARALLPDPPDLHAALCDLNVPAVFLRDGAAGAWLLTARERLHLPPAPVRVVDVTGGGNSASGALLAARCAGHDWREAGARASVSAALCLEQFGPPGHLDAALRQRARHLLSEVLARMSEVEFNP